jgi:hypothetical protein
MNEATIKITGVERELLPVLTFDYFTEPQMAREVSGGIRKGSVADSPLTLRHKEGKLTDVLFNGSVYKDDQGMSWESLLSPEISQTKKEVKQN